jgi:hypothetical protein
LLRPRHHRPREDARGFVMPNSSIARLMALCSSRRKCLS